MRRPWPLFAATLLAFPAAARAQEFADTQRLAATALFAAQDAATARREAEQRRVDEIDRRAAAQAVLLDQQAASVARLGDELQGIRAERQLIDLAAAFDAAIAAGRWEAARALLGEDVTLDIADRTDAVATVLPADAALAAVRQVVGNGGVLPRANQDVVVDAGSATVTSDGYAWGAPGRAAPAPARRFGRYAYRFARTPAGWRIDGLAFHPITPAG
ncbi:nuclear transport factor 2 family protein [uncultured Sphingomonas sp.]|uniref:nuclear transport factor 2 family protein n=1 Tax=uncultured Sphingomonas sp. TaxID=158754 RepID=UPI0035CA9E22